MISLPFFPSSRGDVLEARLIPSILLCFKLLIFESSPRCILIKFNFLTSFISNFLSSFTCVTIFLSSYPFTMSSTCHSNNNISILSFQRLNLWPSNFLTIIYESIAKDTCNESFKILSVTPL